VLINCLISSTRPGQNIQNRSTSQNTPRSGGTKNTLIASTDIMNYETYKVGKYSKLQYGNQKESSSMKKSMKLCFSTRNHGIL